MGDIGDGNVALSPILPPAEAPLRRSKSSALHIEDRATLMDEVGDRLRKAQQILQSVAEINPADSPMAISNAPSSLKSNHDEIDGLEDFTPLEREREPLTQVNTRDPNIPSRAPSPIRNFLDEPKLWLTDGPGAGKAVAEWKDKLVPKIHDYTAHMSIEERTKCFDDLVEDDKERHLAPLAAYYHEHREHIPERELSEKAQKKVELGYRENARITLRQNTVFKNWDFVPNAPKVVVEELVGPKNETIPGEMAECKHCIKEANKSSLRKRASTFKGLFSSGRRRATIQVVKAPKLKDTKAEADSEAVDDESLAESSDAKSKHSDASARGRKLAQEEETQPTDIHA